MSSPTYFVYVGFQSTTGFSTPFQLNDPTYGQLNYGGGLGGIELVDLTDQVLSVSITRGRNRETESFNAGSAVVRFKDPSRALDPLNTASPYYPYVQPRQPIYITASNFPNPEKAVYVFSGVVADWNLSYDYTTNGNVMEARCSDGFTVLANMTLNEWTPTEQSSSARVEAVLSRPEVEYQGGTDIEQGISTLGAYEVAQGTNVLSYLQQVTFSENGFLFMTGNGTLRFVGRHTQLNVDDPSLEFAENGSGIPYRALTNTYGDELLFNHAHMQSPAGAVQEAQDAESIALYQNNSFSRLNLLNSTTAEVKSYADAWVGLYKDPLLRFNGLQVLVQDVPVNVRQELLSLDLCDVVSVQKSFSTGTPSSVTRLQLVTGIAHSITPGSHTITLTFEDIDTRAYLVLDSEALGVLNQNLLAF